jgi:AP-1 complex subunit gamma-1
MQCTVTEKFAPSKRWHVDTILRIMSIAGQHVPDEVCATLIILIGQSPELHA